ncbi:hypothetical protein BJX99DRAFT_227015 [Aspergillus californicus]
MLLIRDVYPIWNEEHFHNSQQLNMDPSSSSRPARLSTADRKRLTDRKAQRQRRERIKTYTARLEKTIEELTTSSGNGMEATLLKQLEQQRTKNERLTGVINHIHEVLEETRSSSPGAESPLTLGSGLSTAASGSGSASTAIPKRTSNLGKQPQQPSNHNPTYIINIDLATKISLHSQNPSNDGTRNYFQVVNDSISNVAKEQSSITPSTSADDDDLAIRAILHGWDSIRDGDRITGDGIWGLLQALDQGIFSQTGMVERVAILRLMRSMIKVFLSLFCVSTALYTCRWVKLTWVVEYLPSRIYNPIIHVPNRNPKHGPPRPNNRLLRMAQPPRLPNRLRNNKHNRNNRRPIHLANEAKMAIRAPRYLQVPRLREQIPLFGRVR